MRQFALRLVESVQLDLQLAVERNDLNIKEVQERLACPIKVARLLEPIRLDEGTRQAPCVYASTLREQLEQLGGTRNALARLGGLLRRDAHLE
ncbi:hypothetical protein [Myxococcus xanthus]|uniref:hypothetical protein n=1 Tax=Myxococcus xanthus TaxID=34 RepID=UPI0003029D1C|nr:hypothetical protein MyxoNM_02955 [Myxococcus xanthus]SDW58264.1 hypothetical protein SAMN05444383_102716 [Myxococcus xanthus]